MTREEAEIRIRAVFNNYFYFAGDREADEVIEALKQEQKYCDHDICIRNEHNGIGCGECEVTKSQEPCGKDINVLATDAISREAVEDAIIWNDEKREMLDEIQKLPSVQPKQKTGHWIKTKEQNDAEPLILWKCSECLTVQRLKTKHCPNCGARMAESEDKG